MHIQKPLLLVALGVAISYPAQAQQDAYTTRIEPRPIYGAVVTIEHGVRVCRPLPPTTHLIINPEGVPLMLNVGEPAAAYWHWRRWTPARALARPPAVKIDPPGAGQTGAPAAVG